MKGLLYKEFRMFAFQIKTWAAVLVFLMVCCLITDQTGPFIGGMCGFVVISSLAPFTEEKRQGSDAYTAALPVSRREIVKARIVFLAFVMAAVFLATALLSGSRMPVTEGAVMTGLIIGLIFAAVLLIPSYFLSAAAMERKDFQSFIYRENRWESSL